MGSGLVQTFPLVWTTNRYMVLLGNVAANAIARRLLNRETRLCTLRASKRANFLYPIRHEWWGPAASACSALTGRYWQDLGVGLTLEKGPSVDLDECPSGRSWTRALRPLLTSVSLPLRLVKWSVHPWFILSSLIIISRYSFAVCLSGRGCYQKWKRGTNTCFPLVTNNIYFGCWSSV